VVLVAFIVEAAAGFGGTVVSVSLGSQLMDVSELLLRFLPANLLLSAVMVARTRHEVDLRTLLVKIAPFMGAGMVLGAAVARAASPAIVKVVFAAFVLGLAAIELRKGATDRPPSGPLPFAVGAGALLAAGVLHGMFACGGPLAVWVVGRDLPEKGRFRATLSALWLVLNAALVAGYVVERKITPLSLRDSALLVVPLVLGIVVGERVHRSLSPTRFRRAVFVLLGVASLALLVRSLVALAG